MNYTKEEVFKAKLRADAAITSFFKKEITRLLHKRAVESVALSDLTKPFQQNFQDYVKGGFLHPIWNLYSAEERSLIKDVANRFERVRLGFAYFSLLSSNERPYAALHLTQSQLRTGWQRTGVSNQTIQDHDLNGESVAVILFPDDPRVAEHFPCHDIDKSVLGDFTPYEAITTSEKKKIKGLGIRLLSEAAPQGHTLAQRISTTYNVCEGEAPEHDVLRSKIKDCDLLDRAIEMIIAMDQSPKGTGPQISVRLEDYWDGIGPNLTSMRAKRFFDVLENARYGLPCSPAVLLQLATEAMPENFSEREHLESFFPEQARARANLLSSSQQRAARAAMASCEA